MPQNFVFQIRTEPPATFTSNTAPWRFSTNSQSQSWPKPTWSVWSRDPRNSSSWKYAFGNVSAESSRLIVPLNIFLKVQHSFQVRDNELDELDSLQHEHCELVAKSGSENVHGKVNILIQTFLSHGRVNYFSLCSDLAYISQVRSQYKKNDRFLQEIQRNLEIISQTSYSRTQ